MDLSIAFRKGLKGSFLKLFQGFILIVSFSFPIQSVSAADYWPGEQWRTATPESQGMRSGVLADMLDLVWQKNLEIDSILIIRNGHVVLDTYHFPRKPDSKHNVFSCTKSISSTLIGIAIDKKYIQSIDQPLLDFFPGKTPRNPDEGKHEITLKHVLQMATGLGCRDSYLYQWWVMSPERYAARGYRGQRIFVLKDKNMVVVFTGRLKNKDLLIPAGILNGYIIPAVQSDRPLPEDKEALDRLRFLDRFWQTATYMDRDKRRKELAAEPPGPKLKRYVSKELGFSVEYDAELMVGVHPLEPPFVLRNTSISGIPGILVAVDDIPQGLKLEKSEQYVTEFIKGTNQFSDIYVNHKEMIRLADGTTANYFEIGVKFMPTAGPLVLAGVVGYKGKKMICVVATGPPDVPIEYLKSMVQSMKFDADKKMVSHLKI